MGGDKDTEGQETGHSLKSAQISPACRHLPTCTDRRSRRLQCISQTRCRIWGMNTIPRKCLRWAIGPHGRTGDYQRRQGCLHYNRCSLWLSEWGMRCDRSADRPMRQDSSLEVHHLLGRTGVSAPNSRPDGTTQSFVVLVVASLVTCRHVAQNQTRHCLINPLVGSYSPRAMDSEMDETGRKTHPRPGFHPPWSTRASFDPHSSSNHHIIMGFIITK